MEEENKGTSAEEDQGRWNIIAAIIVLLVLALIGGGYYYFFFRNGLSIAEEEADSPLPPAPFANGGILGGTAPPEPTISVDSWLRYRNDQYGFEVKYPIDWTAESSFIESSKFVYLSPAASAQGTIRPAVAVEIYPEQKTLVDVLSNFDYLRGTYKDVTVGGVAAKQITANDQDGREIVVLVAAKSGVGFSVTASWPDAPAALSQISKRILSTFTFFK